MTPQYTNQVTPESAIQNIGVLSRLRPLDVLRGLAISGVLIVHTSHEMPTASLRLDGFLGWGRFGVQLFFIVSAFTMCHQWVIRAGEPNKVRNFYIRRSLRITPLFWLAIPFYLLINGAGVSYWSPEGISAADVALTAAYLHPLWPSSVTSVVPGGWSIGCEMIFYALFPLLAKMLGKSWRFLWLAVAIYLVNKVAIEPVFRTFLQSRFSASSHVLINNFLYLTFLNQFPVLLVGCHVFHSFRRPVRQLTVEAAPPFVAWAAIAVCLTLSGCKPVGLDMLAAVPVIYSGAIIVLRYSLVVGWLATLGRYSYGIYLSHFAILHMLGPALKRAGVAASPGAFVLALVLTTIAALVVAMILHRTVEEPVAEVVRRLTSSRRGSVAIT